MRILWATVLLAASLVTAQDGPPPEPPADRPACNNFYSTPAAHKCSCGKAMKCHGRIDEPPDPDVPGMKWCSQFCKASKCNCVGPCESRRHTGKHNAE